MGFFSFIETFFFISLIITFVLLAMLVYHFKQRILKLEDKTNTLVEIVNDIVKEMKSVSNLGNTHNNIPFGLPINSSVPLPLFRQDPAPENIKTILIEDTEVDNESDNSDSKTDSETESESDVESTESDSSSESDIDFELDDDEDMSNSHMMLNLEPVLQNPIVVENEPETKTILVDLGNDVEVLSEINIESFEIHKEPEVETEVDPDIETELEPEIETQPVSSSISNETTSNKKEIYENMTPAMLKSLIIQRGITSLDVSKIKKNKLVQILLDSDE